MQITVDINENEILSLGEEILQTLLLDHTMGRNILWATKDYEELGQGYGEKDTIEIPLVTGENCKVVMPRVLKSREQQSQRSKEMAEVFTPSWVCNKQNNLVDNAWFQRENIFNEEIDTPDSHTWKTTTEKITFPQGKTWKDYVRDTRMEITCGEAPYLVSRYDTTTGEFIPVQKRIGLLDRKLRVISENVDDSGEWLKMAQEAYENTYGYEWQGDNLLLAREALLITFIEYYKEKFHKDPLDKSIKYIAYIVSWNLWQMDGLKFCIPGEEPQMPDLFNPEGNMCLIRDWRKPREQQKIMFSTLING